MNLEIRNFTKNDIDEGFFVLVAKTVLEEVSVIKKTQATKDIEISLAIVGDNRIRKLNKLYRGHNKVTDVLSFENKSVIPYLTKAFPKLRKNERSDFVEALDNKARLGEIIICHPRAKKQAKKAGHSLKEELTILTVHGILHLLGYDHEKKEEEALEMEKLQDKIIQKIMSSKQ